MQAAYQIVDRESKHSTRELAAFLAEERLALLEQRTFDLVVMDIGLPGMDGKEATRRLRADQRFATLPIVAATAHVIKEQSEAILETGVSTIIPKPIDEDEFLQTIASLISRVK
jgi:CheY-like chemotaxis protein